MRIFLFLLCSGFFISSAWSQDAEAGAARITDSIVTEGKRLYRSEMASWYGTDIFMETFKDRSGKAGGYFSYSDQKVTHCLFFSDADTPVVLATMTFDSTFKATNATIDGDSRSFTTEEKDLYEIRQLALAEINKDRDFFKMYENCNFNIIPLISNGEKKVYVLTGPKITGIVVFGNDYLLRFDKDNRLIEKRQLHKNIISIKYGKDEKEESTGWHSHLPERVILLLLRIFVP